MVQVFDQAGNVVEASERPVFNDLTKAPIMDHMPEGQHYLAIIMPAADNTGLFRIGLVDPTLVATQQSIEQIVAAVNLARQGLVDGANAKHAEQDALIKSLQDQLNTIQLTPGPRGPAGPQGTPGAPGKDGVTGPQGLPGTAGKDGAKGETGAQGSPGVAGSQGVPGVAGAAGKDGATGPQGVPGTAGAAGKDGATGAAGKDGIIPQYEPTYNATTGAITGFTLVTGKVELLVDVTTNASGVWSIDYTAMGFTEVPRIYASSMSSSNLVAEATNVSVSSRTKTAATGMVTKPVTLLALGLTQVAAANTVVQLLIVGKK